jgi:peptidoglycan/LPS O-acetylase OafA/YrhL
MVGGFLMVHTRLCGRSREENAFSIWWDSFKKIFPTYFMSIFISLLLKLDPRNMYLYERTILPQLALVFNWVPQELCFPVDSDGHVQWNPDNVTVAYREVFCVEGLNEPAWYLGSLQVYWLLFFPVFLLVKKCSQIRVVMLLLLSWSLCLFWPIWFSFHDAAEGTWVRTLQEFHPVSHFHKFVFGMCVGRLFVDLFCRERAGGGGLGISDAILDNNPELTVFAPLALLILLLIFFAVSIDDFMFLNLASYEFVLLPVFAMLVVGLSMQKDVISRALVWGPLQVFERYDISYEIYILQGCAFEITEKISQIIPVEVADDGWSRQQLIAQRIMFPFVLVVFAILANQFLKWPAGKPTSGRSAGRSAVAPLMS